MTAPKPQPCPKCGNIYVEMYGYGDWGTTWHVECDECHYLGPGGNKLQAIREHNAIAMEARQGGDGETRLHPKDDSAGPQDIAQSEEP